MTDIGDQIEAGVDTPENKSVKLALRSNELQRMRPHHRAIAILAASLPKKSTQEIADITGFHQQSVARLLKTPLMEAEVARLQGDVEETLKASQLKMLNLVDRSIQVIEENLGDPDNDIEPAVDRDQMTQDAWDVYKTAIGGKSGNGGGVSVNVQIASFTKEAAKMNETELVEEVLGSIRVSKDTE